MEKSEKWSSDLNDVKVGDWIAPQEHFYGSLQGKEFLFCDGKLDLPLGLSREEVEQYLTLQGVELALYRALAMKAGVPVKDADWYWHNM